MSYREDGALLDAYAGLYNMSTGAGTLRDKSLNFEVNLQAANISREECSALFKTSGLVQKIVALLPEDSPVEWYSLNLGKDTTAPQEITNYLEDKLSLHEKLVEASVLARLHRNAYIVIFANDGRKADEPLDEENLEEIVELKVLSSYELRPSVWGTELGGYSLVEPEYYDLIGLWELNKRLKDEQKIPLNQMRIHKSRVLKFSGRKLYGWMLHENHGEDLSVLQSILVAFGSYMQGVMASSGMIQDYSVFTYKLKGLADLILKGQSDQIIRRFLAIQMGMSYNKGLAMDAETEDAGFVQRNYGGVGDIVDRLKALLTAESGIPHTKLWGEGSQGNTSGQSEKYDYADALESFQRHNWLKPTKVLARLCLISKKGITKGKIPEGWRLSTRSSLRLDLETEAKLRQTQARTDQVYRMIGVLHPLEIRKNRFGSPDYSMETVLDPAIDKTLWSKKDDPEFLLPVLAGKPTAAPTGENMGAKSGAAQTGVDVGTKMGQAAIADTGGDGGNNAEMLAQESDRDRMAENRRTDSYERRDAAAKQKLRWGDRTLAIEYLPGDVRHNRRMQGVYGYIQKHTGHDNEPLDFYATPEFHQALCNGEKPVGKIFEIYQLKANADDPLERKMLDETKIILGCDDAKAAIDLYLQHMPPEFMGLVNDLTPEELRHYRYRRDEVEFRQDRIGKKKLETAPESSSSTVASTPTAKSKSKFNPLQPRDRFGRWRDVGISRKRAQQELDQTNSDPYPEKTAQAKLEKIYKYKLAKGSKRQPGKPVVEPPKPELQLPPEPPKPIDPVIDPAVNQKIQKKAEATVENAIKRKRLPTLRKVVKSDSFEISVDGKVEIWQNSEDKKFEASFKFKTNKNFEYRIEHEGKELTLNQHKNGIEILGERVDGVPSYYPKLREMTNEQVFGGLVTTMSLVEDKSNQPTVPDWKPTFHGKVDKDLVRSGNRPGDYGKMQIHHVHQWSKARFDEINDGLKSGAMTLQQAKDGMRNLLQPDPANKINGYAISLENKADRRLVILAEGVHAAPSPLYGANHPKGIHPDTGDMKRFGIPKDGDGGRDWFNQTFRPTFWREYYRRYSFVAANEINRRIRDGNLSPEKAKELWEQAHGKATKYSDYLKDLRKTLE